MKKRSSIFLSVLTAIVFGAAVVTTYLAWQQPKIFTPPKPYSTGDFAAEDLVSPKKFSAVDPVETASQREKELEKGPFLFRFDDKIPAQSVARFNHDFAAVREGFLKLVEKNYGTRQLTATDTESERFRQLVIDFRPEVAPFPFTLVKAARWVQGDFEEKLQQQLAEKLSAASAKYIHPGAWPDAAHGLQLRVITSSELSRSVTNLYRQSELVRRTNVVALAKIQSTVQAQFPREQQATAKYLSGFVEANCFFDEELTRQLREKRAQSMQAMVAFEKGQIIVRRGEKIDAKIKAALDELQLRPPPLESATTEKKRIWLWVGAIFFAALAVIILLRNLFRPRRELVPARNVVALTSVELEGRAMETKVMPHLVRALMNKFVRALISQRAELLENQNYGTAQLNQLEERLEQISERLQTRQAFYEKRIADLEKELAASEEENRALIRLKIAEARQNLELAKAQNQ
ncbi:MAG: hypothetical protein ABJC04_09145 [Verrucomicrobiota bacterium]